ncbi:MAG: Rnf-Nqr domain containing protein [Massiliimalia sp.]|jgi:electron transport complex protein RnfA
MELIVQFASQMCLYALIATFVENTVFSRAIGTSTSLWMIRKKHNIFLFGAVMTIITTGSSILAKLVEPWLVKQKNAFYLTPFVYVCIIGLIYVIMLLVTNRFHFPHKELLLVFIHRCSFNCAVLGALLLSTEGKLDMGGFVGFGIGTGIGFTIATLLVDIAYERLNSASIPRAFRGFPITLFYIGILSLAIYGMIGHELPI